ncbi:MAG: hypothetical protein Q8R72_10015 [Hylemonella sp.]|nr:hypothetical protein [Hylemonella sp.]
MAAADHFLHLLGDPVGPWLLPLTQSSSLTTLVLFLGAHAALSLVIAAGCLPLVPTHLRSQRALTLLLLFNFAFIAPLVGPACIVLITRRSLRHAQQQSHQAHPTSVALPEYDVQASDHVRSSQGSIRSRLEPQVPGPIRMQALLTLQAVPGRVANPILEDLLGDETDDVRLLAFGMLDSEEKHISRDIQRERAQLDTELTVEQRFDCLRHLAGLHWELIYACLAQGELRRHILHQARDYLEAALALGIPPSPGMLLLQGRILLAQQDIEGADEVLSRAQAQGLPPACVIPYLAEVDFLRRRFDRVHAHLAQLAHLNTTAGTTAVVNLWTGRETVSKLSEYHHLPHL